FHVRDDPALAGMDKFAVAAAAAEIPAFDHAHATSAANPVAAVVRDVDAVHERHVEQEVAAVGREGLAVDVEPADSRAHSTSSRIGRTCRVWRIWEWSNAATRMKVPVLIAAS